MSNLELHPQEVLCSPAGADAGVQLLEPRDVPLGGPRAMNVRRTLPQRSRSLIGAWCFLDHYGPEAVEGRGGMRVPRHPHTGLQTISWLFSGEIEHRDSAGSHAWVRPGELNLMTAGSGISHSEFSTPGTTVLHGVQLWTALPEATRNTAARFDHYRPEPATGPGWEARVFLGSLLGSTSPVATHTALLGAEVLLRPGTELELALDPAFEHGFLLDAGDLELNGTGVPPDHLAYLPTGTGKVLLRSGPAPVRLVVIGGEPLGEQIIMWWNFIGRTHEEVVSYRAAWQAEIGAEPDDPAPSDPGHDGGPWHDDGARPQRFGPFPPGQPAPLPAPTLPTVRLRPRG